MSLATCPAPPFPDGRPSVLVHGALEARFRSSRTMLRLHVYLSSGSAAFNFLFCFGAAVVSVTQTGGQLSDLTAPILLPAALPPRHVSLLPGSLQMSQLLPPRCCPCPAAVPATGASPFSPTPSSSRSPSEPRQSPRNAPSLSRSRSTVTKLLRTCVLPRTCLVWHSRPSIACFSFSSLSPLH